MFLRDEVSNNSRKSHGRQEDPLHPPLEQEVLVLRLVRQVQIYRLVHLNVWYYQALQLVSLSRLLHSLFPYQHWNQVPCKDK